MKPWKIDVPILLTFFARPKEFEKVFESVRKAKPSTLLLWQDGPRKDHPCDMENILRCREIAENIDWECKVYRNYHEENIGCDPSTFMAHKWAFSIVDKCIVLEDDFVADQSFYPYCKSLLDKYENDERINHICGMNMLGEYKKDYQYDYFFSYTGSNAWASWKRVVDGWDETYSFLHDEEAIRNLRKKYGKRFNLWYSIAKQRESTGVPYWESILCFNSLMNSRYAIIPNRNMVENIGMTENSTHSKTSLKFLTKTEKRMFNLPVYKMKFPLRHPNAIVNNFDYCEKLDRFFGNGHPLIRAYRKVYRVIMYTIYGELWKRMAKKFKG